MPLDYDVVVAGAGVAGSMAAVEAARQGAKVALVEDHPQVGVPSHCSGVVSLSGLKLLGVESHQAYDQRLIRGARFYSPSGEPVQVRKSEPVAMIINRMRFDQYLAKKAVSNGVDLHTKCRVTKFERRADRTVLASVPDLGVLSCRVLIDASGAGSRLPIQAGLRTPDWSQLLPGLQYELIGTKSQDDMVDLYFGTHTAPGFFAWKIPTGDYSARVGLATAKGNVKALLDRLVKNHWSEAKIEATKSGSVLVSGPVDRCWAPGFLVVGDAAGQVKQTTGGGIVIGGYSGLLAGRAAASAAKYPKKSEEHLEDYDREWREKFSGDLRNMARARRIFSRLSDKTLDKLFTALQPYLGEIETFGDMDFQGGIILRLLSKRQLAALLPRIAADNIRSLFS